MADYVVLNDSQLSLPSISCSGGRVRDSVCICLHACLDAVGENVHPKCVLLCCPSDPPHSAVPNFVPCQQSVRRTVAVRTSGMPCTMEHWVAVLEREHQVTEEKRMRSLQKMEKHRERIENLEKAKEGLRKQLERCVCVWLRFGVCVVAIWFVYGCDLVCGCAVTLSRPCCDPVTVCCVRCLL